MTEVTREVFTYGQVRATIANTFAGQLATETFMDALNVPKVPTNTKRKKADESYPQKVMRLFCWIAGYTDEVTGLGEWQPPDLWGDEAEIRASAKQFLKLADEALMVAWASAVTRVVFPPAPEPLPHEVVTTGG